MLPVLLDLKFIHFKIYTFGVFLVLAFFWSTYLLWKNIRLTSHKETVIFDGIFLSLLGGLFLGRLLHVLTHYDKFGLNILKFILINGYPGISLIGCLFGFLGSFFLFMYWKKIKILEIGDYMVSPLFISLAIGKIGSFFSGVEAGTKTTFPVALRYANLDGFRHLTALYEGILFFLGAYISYKLLFEVRKEKYSKGVTLAFFGWYFGLVYFIFDGLKINKTLIGGQSMNWVVAITLLLTFTLYFLYHIRSAIFSRMKTITNSFNDNVKQTYTAVHSKTTKKVREGTNQSTGTDKEAKSG